MGALLQSLTGIEIDLKTSGRTILYQSLTEEQMLAGARSEGMPESVDAYLAMLYPVVRAGYAAEIAPYPQAVAGQKSLTFEDFAETVADWNGESR